MNSTLPKLKEHEGNTLYIIGNGFDLHHGISSRFKDFCCWLKREDVKEEQFVRDMQIIFPHLNQEEASLWSNFEDALGSYDLDSINKHYNESPDDALGNAKYEIAREQVVKKVTDVCEKVRPLIKRWAKQIDIDDVRPQMRLSAKSYYLTFNYTKVLEEVYNIPLGHICHIHGCTDDVGELITGHDALKPMENYNATLDDDVLEKKIVTVMNTLAKDKYKQIERNRLFFLWLPKNISHVVVLGHSLADIDLRYFGEILKIVPRDAKWHFSAHSERDEKKVHVLVKPASSQPNRIPNYEIFKWE